MTTAVATSSVFIVPGDRLNRWVLRADVALLYLVIFTASGAVFRYGGANTYLWYGVYAWAAARFALELPSISAVAIRHWPIFLWPALAIFSIVWSLNPAATMRGGLQLLMTTAIAAFLGMRFSVREILWALMIVLCGTAIASLTLLALSVDNLFAISGGFQGIFAHKNTMGLRMNILISAALILLLNSPRKTLFAVVILIAVYALAISKSATSQILGLATPAIMIVMLTFRRSAQSAAISISACLAFTAAFAFAMFAADGDPVSFILDGFGKDTTLTGRTWLWDQGMAEIGKHPILGGGYQAFWSYESSSEVRWIRHNTLETVKGFHNVAIEVWNDLGAPGVAALIGVIGFFTTRTFNFYKRMRSVESLYPLFFVLILIVSGGVNNSFFRQHELMHVLFCAFFVATAASPSRSYENIGASNTHATTT